MILTGVDRLRDGGVAKVQVLSLHVRDKNSSKVKPGQDEYALADTCLMAGGYELLNGTGLELRYTMNMAQSNRIARGYMASNSSNNAQLDTVSIDVWTG